MKYKFDVTVQNNNYPLIVLYKVKTFPEYGFQIIPKTELVFDPANNNYRTTVEFSITNWLDGNNVEYHNNLSCIGVNKLTVVAYAFQQGKGSDFDWITPEALRNPENYEDWDTFKDTYADEFIFKPTQKSIATTNINDAVYVSVRNVTRVAIPASLLSSDDDVQNLDITIQVLDSNNDPIAVTPQDSNVFPNWTIRRSQYNYSYFVSDVLDYSIPNNAISAGVKVVATFTGGSSTDFTTTLSKELFNVGVSLYKIDEAIGDSFEAYFSGNAWENHSFSSFKYTLKFAGGTHNITGYYNNIYQCSNLTYAEKTVCNTYTPNTKTFTAKAFNKIFAINPIYCFVDSNAYFNVKQANILNNATASDTFVNYGMLNDESNDLYYELNY